MNKVKKRDVCEVVFLDDVEFLLHVMYGMGGIEDYFLYPDEGCGKDMYGFLNRKYQQLVDEEAQRVVDELMGGERW